MTDIICENYDCIFNDKRDGCKADKINIDYEEERDGIYWVCQTMAEEETV